MYKLSATYTLSCIHNEDYIQILHYYCLHYLGTDGVIFTKSKLNRLGYKRKKKELLHKNSVFHLSQVLIGIWYLGYIAVIIHY